MIEQTVLESRLREVLAVDAQRAPELSPAAARLRLQAAGRMRAPKRFVFGARTRLATALVVLGGSAAGVITLESGGAPAFASWVSRPSAISAADAAALGRVCGVSTTPVIVDRRGHSAYALYDDAGRWSDCLTTIPGLAHDKGLPSSWVDQGLHDRPVDAALPITVISAKAPEGNDVHGSPAEWVSGRVSAEIASVHVITTDGTVIATVAHGYFAAWWPGNDADTAVIEAYDASGGLVATVDSLDCSGAGGVDARTTVSGQAPTGGCAAMP